MKFRFSYLFVLLFCFYIGADAQEKDVVVSANFASSAQPTIVDLPTPKFPIEAKSIRIGGRIGVAVTIDESGHVRSVDQVTGPYPYCPTFSNPPIKALRDAASNSAKNSRFEPSVVDGRAISIGGQINYEFILPAYNVKSESTPGIKMGSADPYTAGLAVIAPPDGNNSEIPHLVAGDNGVINGKAVELGKPSYPPAARAVRAGGSVSVQVLIDENGNLISATAVSGHPLLKHAAEQAACQSRFSPTTLSGQPVKVSGMINYNFVP